MRVLAEPKDEGWQEQAATVITDAQSRQTDQQQPRPDRPDDKRPAGPFPPRPEPEQPALSRPDWVTGTTGEKEDKYKQVSVSW